MKRQSLALALVCFSAGGLTVGSRVDLAHSQDSRIENLEQQVRTMRAQLAATVSYLQEQARGARALEQALQESESAGFTAGINPRSRTVMLSGMREFLAMFGPNLPGATRHTTKPAPRAGSTRKIN